jgi:hypothetical protein
MNDAESIQNICATQTYSMPRSPDNESEQTPAQLRGRLKQRVQPPVKSCGNPGNCFAEQFGEPVSPLPWNAVEAGCPGQLPLSIDGFLPTLAERVFIQLVTEWCAEYLKPVRDDTSYRNQFELELSCVMLAAELGSQFTPTAREHLQKARRLMEYKKCDWIDTLAWEIVSGLLTDSGSAIDTVVLNFDHGSSRVRLYMLDLGWILAAKVHRDESLKRLLESVSWGLVGVRRAWGLGLTIAGSEAALLEFARTMSFDYWEKQFLCRVDEFKGKELECQAYFWELDAVIKKPILSHALNHRCIDASMTVRCS